MVGIFMTAEDPAALIEDEMEIGLVGEIDFDMVFGTPRLGDAIGAVESDTRSKERFDRRLHRTRQITLADILHHLQQRAVSGDMEFALALSRQVDFGDIKDAVLRADRLDLVDLTEAGVFADHFTHWIGTLAPRNLPGNELRRNTARENGK